MKILCIYGTRPEAIKMAPLIGALRMSPHFDTKVLTTGQHLELVDAINNIFDIEVDYPENIFTPGQSISTILSKSINCISSAIEDISPDLVIVQGDTTTAMAGAIAAFSNRTKVGHIEAGLRTNDLKLPFPEEFNRRVISLSSALHFAATKEGRENLIMEGFPEADIFITGNTVIDAAAFVGAKLEHYHARNDLTEILESEKEFVLLTLHRRESWGKPMEEILNSILKVASKYSNLNILFPVHPNPFVRELAIKILGNQHNVFIVPALDYVDMIQVISRCKFVLTDSGGIQEESPYFNKPVLILRSETERMEGVRSGCSQLVGTNGEEIFSRTCQLIEDAELYLSMATSVNPFGDGEAANRISAFLEWRFGFVSNPPIEFNGV